LISPSKPPALKIAYDIEFKRTQTIMQGGDHCDFRFALKKKGLV
jgi:hypothetical protein